MSDQKIPHEIQKLFEFIREDQTEVQEVATSSLEQIILGLASRQDKYETLLNTSFLMANAENKEEVILLIIKTAMALAESEAATYFEYDAKKKALVFHSVSDEKNAHLKSIEVPIKNSVVGKAVTTGEPVVVNDVTKEKMFNSEVDKKTGFTTRNLLCVPVVDKDENVLGAIEVVNRTSGDFTDDDVTMLSFLANNVAITYKIF